MANIPVKRPVAGGLAALMAVLFGLFLFAPALIGPPPADPDHPFDTQATLDRLARILGDEAPHPVDSDAADAVIGRIVQEAEALGFAPVIDDAFHCAQHWSTKDMACARLRNIGFWVTEPGPDAVMIASHHDSVPTGPGAADDGMGVASSLEIARLLKDRDLARPLYVLITDGEEVGLVGASRFIQHDPVAPLIGAVVSLEARGNQGVANMFETSDPNGRDIAALARFPATLVRGPTSNSLAVDIYRAMPNGTDVTEYLKLGMDAANYAVVGRPSHYHTAKDNLEHLDPDAVFHIGASALAGVEGFMSVDAASPDTPYLYSDILGLGIIATPQWMALPVMGLGFALCLVAVWRTRSVQDAALWRVLLWPLAVLVLGGLAAWASGFAVGLVRSETAYGTAHPWALRGLFLAVALGTAALLSRALYKPGSADKHLAGVWAVMLALGLLGSLAMPGVALLFTLPALLVVPAAALIIVRKTSAARIVFGLASLMLICLIVPINALAETALFVEASAPLTVGVLWIFLTLLPLAWRKAGSSRWVSGGAAFVAAGMGLAALMVPAYTSGTPLGLNILHLQSDRMEDAVFMTGTRQNVPDRMAAAAPFRAASLPGFGTALYQVTPAPQPPFPPATLDIRPGADGRIAVRISAPGADRVQLSADGQTPAVTSLRVGGLEVEGADAFPTVDCIGRSCRTLDLELAFEGTQLDLVLSVTRNGLDETADALVAARPDWAGAQHRGDRRIVRRHVSVAGN